MSAPANPADAPLALDDLARLLAASEAEGPRRQLILDHLGDFDREALLTGLKDEFDRYWQSDMRAALRLAEAFLFAATHLGAPDHRAIAMMARGDALRACGHFSEALTALEAAGRAFREQGDPIGWARTRTGWLVASYYLGTGPAALAVVAEARGILADAGMWLRVGGLELNAGWVCWKLGAYDRALDLYDQARRTFESLGESAVVQSAWAKANSAIILTNLGEFAAAIRQHEEVRDIWLRRGDTLRVVQQDQNIAYAYAEQGQYTRAIQAYRAARAAQLERGAPIEAAWTALNLTDCYLGLNLLDQAIESAEDAIAAFERYTSSTGAASAQVYAALAHARNDNAELALTLLDAAVETFAATGLRHELAVSGLLRARLLLDGGDWRGAVEAATASWESFGAQGAVVRQAEAGCIAARAALAGGDATAAARLAGAALAAAERWQIARLLPEGRAVLGEIALVQGDLAAAGGHLGEAVDAIERLQRTMALELRSNYLADKQPIFDRAIAVQLALGQTARAFGYLERAKSRTLVDYLANTLSIQIRARAEGEGPILAALGRARALHNHYHALRYQDRLLPPSAGDTEGPADDDLRARLREQERQITDLLEQLALVRTEGLELVPSPDSADSLPPTDLERGTVLLEYHFDAGGGRVFVVADGAVTALPLATSLADLRRLLTAWGLNLAAAASSLAAGADAGQLASSARRILQGLYRALITPVEERLTDCRRLIVVPYGPLHAVPFHILYDGAGYLLDRHEVVVCPSSNLLRLCRARMRRAAGPEGAHALVIAHTDDGRLPSVLREADAIAALLPGERYVEAAATRATLAAAAPRHRIVHLATHGEARLDTPAFAHLRLADGHLTTEDIFNLELPGALVVLSACETGRQVVAGVDEPIGLSRGFFYAGAATVVQSLWRVEDGSTARLMARFYAALRGGVAKGAALREAQLALRGSDVAHPYCWAPFQLLGDWGAL